VTNAAYKTSLTEGLVTEEILFQASLSTSEAGNTAILKKMKSAQTNVRVHKQLA